VQPGDAPLITALVLEQWNVTERPARRPPGFIDEHPSGNVLLDQLLKVEREFLTELGVQAVFLG
jgi:hypothetical protein